MGSISTVEDENAVYDAIYGIAYSALKPYGFTFYNKDVRATELDVKKQYVYLDQIHGAYEKHTLQPSIYDVDVELLCEINVSHVNIRKGRQMSKDVQRAYLLKASTCGLVVKSALATDSTTTSGHRFAVSISLTYTTKVV